MPFSHIASWFAKRHGTPLERRFQAVDRKIAELEKELSLLKKKEQEEEVPQSPKEHYPVIIENIQIDQIVVEKVEYNNNFGALGIKELTGRLNIGANYHGFRETCEAAVSPKPNGKAVSPKPNENAAPREGPKYVIRAKP
ncbi:hypothetical protein [Paenibacillus thermotolerans]|uniref:hypothetical protein n=1 Tax=Paenibacillus thermotolerans TaxID=3027807 RepID=UPI0023688420|nr:MULTISPECIES: hypothetical protein [unclassified Paenibacillus]